MTDGGHVPGEGLPEHLHAGPDPLGGPEGVAGVAPLQGVATDGGLIPNPAAPHGVIPQQGQQGFTVPAPGLPGDGWTVDQGAPRPAFHFLDQPDGLDEEEDVLLMPGPQGSWGEPAVAAPVEHAPQAQQVPQAPQVEGMPVEPSWPPVDPPLLGGPEHGQQPVHAVPVQPQAPQLVTPLQAQRRPLHAGPPIPDPSMMTGQVPVRSLADRGPSQGGTPAHGIPVVGPGQGTPAHGVPVVAPPQGVPVVEQPQAGVPVVVEPSQVGAPVTVQSIPVVEQPQAGTPAHGVQVVDPSQVGAPVGTPAQGVPVVEQPQAGTPVEGVVAVDPSQAAPVDGAPAIDPSQAASAQGVAVVDPSQAGLPVDGVAVVDPTQAAAPVQDVQVVDLSQAGTPAHGIPVAGQPPMAETVASQSLPVPQVTFIAPVMPEAPAAPGAEPQPYEQVPLASQPVEGVLAVETVGAIEVIEVVESPEAAVAESVAVETVAVEAAEAAEAVAGQPEASAPAQPRRISAFLAAPTSHGLPKVEAAVQPEAPIAAADAPQAVEPVEQPEAPVVEETAEPVAETAVGTGEMPSGQAVAEPVEAVEPSVEAEQPAEAVEAVEAAEAVEAVEAAEAVEAVEAAEAVEPVAPVEAVAAEPEQQPAAEAPQPEQAEPVAEQPSEASEPAQEEAPATEQQPAGPAAEQPAEPEQPQPEESAEPAEPRGPAAPGYDEAGRDAVHQVIRERRDIRNGFRPDPIPHEVLIRVLEAAHTAPSVGYSQPWDFVVIRSAKTRRRMHALAERQREAYADSLPKGRAKQFKEIKIEAILDTPVNIVVTADRTRGGRHTLGRHTQPQMAPYSAALAVENLWLAARAEGLGVGWVSFFDDEQLVRELGLPEHLEVVAYLCVGFVDEFPDEPELEQQGWAKKRPLSWVVHEEQYGNRALPGEEPQNLLAETLRGIRPLDAKALGEAWDRQKRMTKPAGSLGMLEIISAQLSGLSRKCPPPIPEPACVAIFAGDHGVHAQGVTPWPQEVTAQMVGNFLAGGAVINSFAKQIGTEVCVVDVGVAAELPEAVQQGRATGLLPRKVKPGTDDMTQGPAMTREEALQAIEVGIETARDLVAAGNKALVTGDMGIANTTASAALISVFTGLDPAEVTGRGTGIDDETHARKIEVIRAALALHQPDPNDPIGVLAAIGGLEHAAIAGFLLGAASLRTPVVLDGVIAGSAALVAKAIAPEVLAACIAGHRSAEPGHQAALAKLGLRPLIDLDLRLGEGTGALLALPLVQSAARAMHDVATFDSAGVTEKA
ncbi:nicotinate-nucleotide--dimethylbenzimidazole phosphoribosyltransferase [Kitasatospora sp. NPDC051170]|uniref:nicotinate-nucleotide--dimethylbenzimidazole phosphoribosyltransferase n=1 Tax=Kitasatospora sp. NPDC051170 TaxID=3364056 RepID=UPI0037B1D709